MEPSSTMTSVVYALGAASRSWVTVRLSLEKNQAGSARPQSSSKPWSVTTVTGSWLHFQPSSTRHTESQPSPSSRFPSSQSSIGLSRMRSPQTAQAVVDNSSTYRSTSISSPSLSTSKLTPGPS